MSITTKTILYIIGAIVGLAALITAVLYDWSNQGPSEAPLYTVNGR